MARNAAFHLAPIALAVMTANPVPVVAQERSTGLEEVIVTAQRRETMLQETPIAVTAFTSDQIVDRGIWDITDIGSLAPNTNIQKQPSSNSNMSIAIRGIGSGEIWICRDH